MAPSVEIPQPTLNPAFRQQFSNYKEAFITGPKVFNKDAELHGTETQPAAKCAHYLPTWDQNERKYGDIEEIEAKITFFFRL